jgi:hypothetical protein
MLTTPPKKKGLLRRPRYRRKNTEMILEKL